ncbi:hypothetical protein GA0115246_1010217, partial [Streptomyces sp. SolWspMP-sol7th]
MSSADVNCARAWSRDALVTSIRLCPRPGTSSAIEGEESTTTSSRALCTVMVHIPRVSWRAFAEGGSAVGEVYGCGARAPAASATSASASPPSGRKPSARSRRCP